MVIHSSSIPYMIRRKFRHSLPQLVRLTVAMGLFMMICEVADATPTQYSYFNEYTFAGNFQVTTTLQFVADPDKQSTIPDFSTLESFRWFVGGIDSMSASINAGNSCGTLCMFDLTNHASSSNLDFSLQSDSSYSVIFNGVTKPVTNTAIFVEPTGPGQLLLNKEFVFGNRHQIWTAQIVNGQPIPEPATIWLMLTGLLGLGVSAYWRSCRL